MVKFTGTSMVRGREALGSNPKDRERRFLPGFLNALSDGRI